MSKKKKEDREWKTGEKLGIKGTVKAALDHHPDIFSKDGKDGKLNPYAIFTAMKKKKGMTPHYKNQESTLKGKSEKKKAFKEFLERRDPKLLLEMRYLLPGDRVRLTYEFNKTGEITSIVPGNGKPGEEWYFINFDDGSEDRCQIQDIERE
jgi:hypothetical protein